MSNNHDSRENFDRPATLYIAGTGRSGSTLLDRILGGSESVIGCGELSFLFEVYRKHRDTKCGCQNKIRDCKVWAYVFEQLESKLSFQKKYEHYEKSSQNIEQSWPYKKIVKSQILNDYDTYNRLLFKSISEVAPDCKFILDSSTTGRFSLFRPLALSRYCGQKVYMVHLTRDPRGLSYGFLSKPANSRTKEWINTGPAGIYTYTKWLATNVLTLLQSFFVPGVQYYYLNYDEFMADPLRILKEIEHHFDIDSVVYREEEGHIGFSGRSHQMTGNIAVLHQDPLRLHADSKWQDNLPRSHKIGALPFIVIWKLFFEWIARLRSRC